MNITKSVVVAIAASLLCGFIFLPLSLFLGIEADLEIGRLVSDCHLRLFITIFMPGTISCVISGLLMGVLIGFVSKNNRMFTTISAAILVTIFYILLLWQAIWLVAWSFKNQAQVLLACSYVLELVVLWVCTFLGVWLVSRRNRKVGQQSLLDESTKAVTQP